VPLAGLNLCASVLLVFIPLGVPYLNRMLYRPSVGLMRLVLRRLVADKRKLPDNSDRVAYAAATLPGAKASWLSLLEELIRLGRLNLRHYLRDELTQLDIPTLFIWGDADYFAPPSSGGQCCAMMPQARIEVLPKVGHLVWIDQLERCTELIAVFILSLWMTELRGLSLILPLQDTAQSLARAPRR